MVDVPVTYLVAGLGVSGRAVVDYLRRIDAQVVTYDDHSADADWTIAEDVDHDVIDVVIASPGLPPHHPVLADAVAAHVPVWSDVELAWRARVANQATGVPAPWITLTGTNGKTTTVHMVTSILQAAGHKVATVGNIGQPIISAVTDPAIDVFAVELSSAQLHFVHTMAPLSSAVLNLAPDHLTWHGSLEAYTAAKGRIYDRVERACVYNVSDPVTRELVENAEVQEGARAVGFSLEIPAAGDIGIVDDGLIDRAWTDAGERAPRGTATLLASLADLEHLAGPEAGAPPHVVANAAAAAALTRAAGIRADAVAAGLRDFQSVRHRIQRVDVIDGVMFINDSKATNSHAAAASLGAFRPDSVVWIAGGLAKGAEFDDLVTTYAPQLHSVVLIGADRAPIRGALGRHAPEIPVIEIEPGDTGTVMQRAVAAAFDLATEGMTVLLAPGSASMDQFRSYEDRGDQFIQQVHALKD